MCCALLLEDFGRTKHCVFTARRCFTSMPIAGVVPRHRLPAALNTKSSSKCSSSAHQQGSPLNFALFTAFHSYHCRTLGPQPYLFSRSFAVAFSVSLGFTFGIPTSRLSAFGPRPQTQALNLQCVTVPLFVLCGVRCRLLCTRSYGFPHEG